MGLKSIAARNASLANDYGASTGPNAAAAHEVAFYAGDPENGGVELDSAGGYVRPLLVNDGTSWAAPAGGAVSSVIVDLPTSTDEWTVGGFPAVADYFLLIDSTTGDEWDTGLLAEPISVAAAGETPHAQLTVYYENLGA